MESETDKGYNSEKKLTTQDGLVMPKVTTATAHDWQTGKSLTECLHHVFTKEIGSDVTFIVGEEKKKVSAHKFILTTRSAVFFSMFNGPLKEKGDVEIPDVEEEIFRQFLCFLYTDKIKLTVETVLSVMSVSRKYFVDVLVELSQEFVRKNLYPTNVCFLLEEAHCYAEEDTMEVCLEFISTCPKAVMESESFLRLCPECLIRITKSDEMSVAESTVYSSAMKWAEEECGRKNIQNTSENKRTVLGNIFDTIRFPIMDMNFFLDNVCVDKILTNDEVINILMFMRGNENGFDTTFNKNKRRFKHIYNNPAFGNVFGSGPSFILATSIGHGLFNN